jgi:glycosyltransferase involved in cell wall biosynthesis
MRLLFVGTSKTGGGTETHFVTLAKALADSGHAVAAVVRPNAPIHKALESSAVALFDGNFRNSLDFRGIGAVNRAIQDFKPDWLVGSFSKEYWPLVFISRRRKIPLALFRHMATVMKKGTQYFIPRLAQRFIVISNFMKDLFVERGVPANLLHVLHNPLDLDYFKPDPQLRARSRESLGLPEGAVLVGYVGALHPGKGIYVLHQAMERAMQQNSNLYMLWIGTGVDKNRFHKTINSSGFQGRIIRKGYVDDVRPWYAAMDLLAVPSIEFDTFGRVSIEAQACGTPVFGSRLGGIVETLEEGVTGELLPPGDVEAWAQAIVDFCRSTVYDRPRKGRNFVAVNFSPKQIAREFVKILNKDTNDEFA